MSSVTMWLEVLVADNWYTMYRVEQLLVAATAPIVEPRVVWLKVSQLDIQAVAEFFSVVIPAELGSMRLRWRNNVYYLSRAPSRILSHVDVEAISWNLASGQGIKNLTLWTGALPLNLAIQDALHEAFVVGKRHPYMIQSLMANVAQGITTGIMRSCQPAIIRDRHSLGKLFSSQIWELESLMLDVWRPVLLVMIVVAQNGLYELSDEQAMAPAGVVFLRVPILNPTTVAQFFGQVIPAETGEWRLNSCQWGGSTQYLIRGQNAKISAQVLLWKPIPYKDPVEMVQTGHGFQDAAQNSLMHAIKYPYLADSVWARLKQSLEPALLGK